jgi:hypothetical protein
MPKPESDAQRIELARVFIAVRREIDISHAKSGPHNPSHHTGNGYAVRALVGNFRPVPHIVPVCARKAGAAPPDSGSPAT